MAFSISSAVDSNDPLAWIRSRKPAEQHTEFARRDPRHQIGNVAARRLEQLCRDQRAERVGREIPPGPVIPMDVLKTALAIVVGGDAEQLVQPLRPGAGEVGRLEIAGEHCSL